MAKTVKDLLAVKKMNYQELVDTKIRRPGGFGRGRDDEFAELSEILISRLEHDGKLTRLLGEISYLESKLDSEFESVSFMVTEREMRQLECIQ